MDTLKRTIETESKKFETQRQKIIDEYERKMTSSAGTLEKELRRELETVKKSQQFNEQTWETQKQDFERKMKNLQQSHQSELEKMKSELERVKTSSTARRETTSSSRAIGGTDSL